MGFDVFDLLARIRQIPRNLLQNLSLFKNLPDACRCAVVSLERSVPGV
jgi:hypothetical protein